MIIALALFTIGVIILCNTENRNCQIGGSIALSCTVITMLYLYFGLNIDGKELVDILLDTYVLGAIAIMLFISGLFFISFSIPFWIMIASSLLILFFVLLRVYARSHNRQW